MAFEGLPLQLDNLAEEVVRLRQLRAIELRLHWAPGVRGRAAIVAVHDIMRLAPPSLQRVEIYNDAPHSVGGGAHVLRRPQEATDEGPVAAAVGAMNCRPCTFVVCGIPVDQHILSAVVSAASLRTVCLAFPKDTADLRAVHVALLSRASNLELLELDYTGTPLAADSSAFVALRSALASAATTWPVLSQLVLGLSATGMTSREAAVLSMAIAQRAAVMRCLALNLGYNDFAQSAMQPLLGTCDCCQAVAWLGLKPCTNLTDLSVAMPHACLLDDQADGLVFLAAALPRIRNVSLDLPQRGRPVERLPRRTVSGGQAVSIFTPCSTHSH